MPFIVHTDKAATSTRWTHAAYKSSFWPGVQNSLEWFNWPRLANHQGYQPLSPVWQSQSWVITRLQHLSLRVGYPFHQVHSQQLQYRSPRTDNVHGHCERQILKIKSVWQYGSHQRSCYQKKATTTSAKYVVSQRIDLLAMHR